MNQSWRRPHTLFTTTEEILTSCGKLFLSLSYIDEEHTKLAEVMITMGRGGTCGNVKFSTIAKLLSMLIQSPLSRKKLSRKLRKQFTYQDKREAVNCGQPFIHQDKNYSSCEDIIAQKVIKALNL